MDLGLRDRVVVVTGGASGIGRASVALFAAEGARVVVADLAPADDLVAALPAGRALSCPTDVTDEADVERLFERALTTFGAVAVLVNGAGVFARRPIADIDAAEWDRVLDVNLRGMFLCARRALAHMTERRRGAIVNVASLAGQAGGIYAGAHYVASKGGVIALTKALARDAGRFGVRVNCVNPGVIDTPMTATFPDEVRAATARAVPLGRWGTAAEVAGAIVFLASDAASFVHGAHLDVNGGVHMA